MSRIDEIAHERATTLFNNPDPVIVGAFLLGWNDAMDLVKDIAEKWRVYYTKGDFIEDPNSEKLWEMSNDELYTYWLQNIYQP